MSVEEIPNDHSPAIMVNESNHRFNSILTDRCKWKHEKFMKKARKVCKKNIKYLLDEAIFRAICATRQLAKRQITWMRSWSVFSEIKINEYIKLENEVKKAIS